MQTETRVVRTRFVKDTEVVRDDVGNVTNIFLPLNTSDEDYVATIEALKQYELEEASDRAVSLVAMLDDLEEVENAIRAKADQG